MQKEGTPIKGMKTRSNKEVWKVPQMYYSKRSSKAYLTMPSITTPYNLADDNWQRLYWAILNLKLTESNVLSFDNIPKLTKNPGAEGTFLTYHSLRISTSPSLSRLPQPTYHMMLGIIWISVSASSQSTSQLPYLGMRTNLQPQWIANPYNQAITSTIVLLLQVMMLIDNNSFAQSFMIAYIHA